MEADQQVPQNKKLIRPEPVFVVKCRRKMHNTQEKMFVNIVQHRDIEPPQSVREDKGNRWSVPYSLGPMRMEKDKCISHHAPNCQLLISPAFLLCFPQRMPMFPHLIVVSIQMRFETDKIAKPSRIC